MSPLFPCGAAFPCAAILATCPAAISSRNSLGHWLGARGVPSDRGLGEDPLHPALLPSELSPLPAGTSPHAPTSVHVVAAMTSANVSWEPGYDGGYEQTFSVWYGPL